jgi:lipopolysaccharide heptosyltransferase I
MELTDKRILIVKPSSLGDVVHTLPLVHAIKRSAPSSYIAWVIQRGFASIIEHDSAVDEIISIDIPSTSDPLAPRGVLWHATVATVTALLDLRRRLKEHPYDLVLDLHASFRSGLIARLNPHGRRIGFADAKELNTLFQHELVHPDESKLHAVDKNLAFAKYLRISLIPEDFCVETSREARNQVADFLFAHGVEPSSRVVYANPAARWESKFWYTEGWAELADHFIERARASVVFAGGSGDVPYIEGIIRRMKRTPVAAAGKLSLVQAVALLERADVYVGVDSGPMHIAAFTGTPVVALFGPTDPAKVGPYGSGHRVIVRQDLDCLACRRRSCEDRKCLEGITPALVFEETVSLLGW